MVVSLERVVGRFAAIAMVMLVVVGCVTVGPAAPTEPPEQQTAWQRALDDVGPDGRYSKDAALRLFATAFGPLPGADVAQDLTGIRSRTIALRAVHAHWDALTPEQRSAVEAAMVIPPDAETINLGPAEASTDLVDGLTALARPAVARPVVLAAAAQPTVSPELKQAIEDAGRDFRARIAASLGRDILGDVDIHFRPQPGDSPTLFGQAWGRWPGGVYGGCDISLFPHATAREPLVFLNTLAHELFHCFQFDGYRTQPAMSAAPNWVIEGQAEWVGNIIGGEDFSDIAAWRKYLTQPERPLIIRTYDAIGFYSHLAETGTDPWSIFEPMWAAGSDSFAAFRQADAETDVFLDSWASSVLRELALGTAWDTTGPGIPDDKYVPPRLSIAVGDRLPVEAAFWTNNADFVTVTAELLHMEVDGHARLSDGSVDTPELEDAWFCTAPGGCECPDGEPLPFAAPQLSGDIAIAASGGLDGTAGRASGHSLDEFCEEPTPTPGTPRPDEARPPCETPCGMSNGDPHLVTIDLIAYDFMAAGEFVALRSADGSFEMQARQIAYPGASSVSINSAVALRVGGQRVGVYTDIDAGVVRTRVDGAEVDTSVPIDLGGGGRLSPVEKGVLVEAPDGTAAWLTAMGTYGIHVMVEPSAALREEGAGILGRSPLGGPFPFLPDGSAIPEPSGDRTAYHEALYVRFADAWRVTPETSLFDYEPGESTETFTIAGFPAPEDIRTLEDLTPEQRAAGEAACAFIPIPEMRDQCIYDVGITSDAGWAGGYEVQTQLLTTDSLPQTGTRVRLVNGYSDETTTAVDVYGTSDEGVKLLATVPFGEASEFVDPGFVTTFDGGQEVRIQLHRAGSQEPFILPSETITIGGRATIVIWADPDNLNGAVDGGQGAWVGMHHEASSLQPTVPTAADGLGMLFADLRPLEHTEGLADTWYATVDPAEGCLEHRFADPDFPFAQPQPLSPGYSGETILPPGQHELTLHADDPAISPFDCSTEPILPPIPLDVSAGDRFFLFAFAEAGSSEVRTLVLPIER